MKVESDLTAKDAKEKKVIFRGMRLISRFSFLRRVPRGLTKRYIACAMN
jgi:hypothetical protein